MITTKIAKTVAFVLLIVIPLICGYLFLLLDAHDLILLRNKLDRVILTYLSRTYVYYYERFIHPYVLTLLDMLDFIDHRFLQGQIDTVLRADPVYFMFWILGVTSTVWSVIITFLYSLVATLEFLTYSACYHAAKVLHPDYNHNTLRYLGITQARHYGEFVLLPFLKPLATFLAYVVSISFWAFMLFIPCQILGFGDVIAEVAVKIIFHNNNFLTILIPEAPCYSPWYLTLQAISIIYAIPILVIKLTISVLIFFYEISVWQIIFMIGINPSAFVFYTIMVYYWSKNHLKQNKAQVNITNINNIGNSTIAVNTSLNTLVRSFADILFFFVPTTLILQFMTATRAYGLIFGTMFFIRQKSLAFIFFMGHPFPLPYGFVQYKIARICALIFTHLGHSIITLPKAFRTSLYQKIAIPMLQNDPAFDHYVSRMFQHQYTIFNNMSFGFLLDATSINVFFSWIISSVLFLSYNLFYASPMIFYNFIGYCINRCRGYRQLNFIQFDYLLSPELFFYEDLHRRRQQPLPAAADLPQAPPATEFDTEGFLNYKGFEVLKTSQNGWCLLDAVSRVTSIGVNHLAAVITAYAGDIRGDALNRGVAHDYLTLEADLACLRNPNFGQLGEFSIRMLTIYLRADISVYDFSTSRTVVIRYERDPGWLGYASGVGNFILYIFDPLKLTNEPVHMPRRPSFAPNQTFYLALLKERHYWGLKPHLGGRGFFSDLLGINVPKQSEIAAELENNRKTRIQFGLKTEEYRSEEERRIGYYTKLVTRGISESKAEIMSFIQFAKLRFYHYYDKVLNLYEVLYMSKKAMKSLERDRVIVNFPETCDIKNVVTLDVRGLQGPPVVQERDDKLRNLIKVVDQELVMHADKYMIVQGNIFTAIRGLSKFYERHSVLMPEEIVQSVSEVFVALVNPEGNCVAFRRPETYTANDFSASSLAANPGPKYSVNFHTKKQALTTALKSVKELTKQLLQTGEMGVDIAFLLATFKRCKRSKPIPEQIARCNGCFDLDKHIMFDSALKPFFLILQQSLVGLCAKFDKFNNGGQSFFNKIYEIHRLYVTGDGRSFGPSHDGKRYPFMFESLLPFIKYDSDEDRYLHLQLLTKVSEYVCGEKLVLLSNGQVVKLPAWGLLDGFPQTSTLDDMYMALTIAESYVTYCHDKGLPLPTRDTIDIRGQIKGDNFAISLPETDREFALSLPTYAKALAVDLPEDDYNISNDIFSIVFCQSKLAFLNDESNTIIWTRPVGDICRNLIYPTNCSIEATPAIQMGRLISASFECGMDKDAYCLLARLASQIGPIHPQFTISDYSNFEYGFGISPMVLQSLTGIPSPQFIYRVITGKEIDMQPSIVGIETKFKFNWQNFASEDFYKKITDDNFQLRRKTIINNIEGLSSKHPVYGSIKLEKRKTDAS